MNPPPDQAEAPRSSPLLHLALLMATFLTTTAAGAFFAHHGVGPLWGLVPLADGLAYSVPLLTILVCHELGHYLVARWHGVDASLPYFIPLPPVVSFGTMGAVIGMRDITSDRKKLIDIGAAGPLAGLVVAVPILLYGLAHSPVRELSPGGQQEGNSILYALLKHAVTGLWLPGGGRDIVLNPTANAAWVGMLVTMINLLPVGQLDGGHIATAYFGNRYNVFARRLHQLLPVVAVAVFFWVLHVLRAEAGAGWKLSAGAEIALMAATFWVLWFVLVSVLRWLSGGVNHPPVDDQPLPPSRRALFWVMVVVFVGTFMPVPLRGTFVQRPAGAEAAQQARADTR